MLLLSFDCTILQASKCILLFDNDFIGETPKLFSVFTSVSLDASSFD